MAGSFGRARSISIKARTSGTRCGRSGRTATHPELIFGNNTLNCYVNAQRGARHRRIVLHPHLAWRRSQRPDCPDRSRQGPFQSGGHHQHHARMSHRTITWTGRSGECFRDPVPIARDYFLVSHAPQKHFGLYAIDRFGNRELLYLDPKISSMCPTPLRPRPVPPVLAAGTEAAAATTRWASSLWRMFIGDWSPAVQRGTRQVFARLPGGAGGPEQLPNGDYRPGPPAVRGLLRLADPPGARSARVAELCGQGVPGAGAGGGGWLGLLLCAGRQGAVFPGAGRAI